MAFKLDFFGKTKRMEEEATNLVLAYIATSLYHGRRDSKLEADFGFAHHT